MQELLSKVRINFLLAFSIVITPFLFFAGAGLLSYGAYLAWHPAAFIVGGVLVLLAAYDSTT